MRIRREIRIRRKPIISEVVLEARELDEYWEITTIVGKEIGRPGDFLISRDGEADWILKKESLEQFYDIVEG